MVLEYHPLALLLYNGLTAYINSIQLFSAFVLHLVMCLLCDCGEQEFYNWELTVKKRKPICFIQDTPLSTH